jgi:hypothetical protein
VTSITTHANYYELNGSFVDGFGFSNDEIISFDFTQTGNVGATGATGPIGPTGVVTATAPITYDSGTQTVGINLTNIAQRNTANTFSVGGHVINNAATGTVPIRVNAIAGQTANLFEIRDSAATNYVAVNSAGSILFGGNSGSFLSGANGRVNIQLSGDNVGLTVRAFSGQSADLVKIQNNAGTDLIYATPTGDMWVTGAVRSLFHTNKNNTGGYLNYSSNSPMFEQRIATEVGLRVRGAASQSANLLELQSSAGTNVAFFTSGGNLRANILQTLGAGFDAREGGGGGGLATMIKVTSLPTNPGANSARLYFRDGTNAGTLKLVVRAGTAGAETTILDNIPT